MQIEIERATVKEGRWLGGGERGKSETARELEIQKERQSKRETQSKRVRQSKNERDRKREDREIEERERSDVL